MSEQRAFFDMERAKRAARKPKPQTEGSITLDLYVSRFGEHVGRALQLPSQAAWIELRRQCKRLAELIDDRSLRAAFLDEFFATADPYTVERDYPLRLALMTERFPFLRRRAERRLRDRAQRVDAPASTKPTIDRKLGRPWVLIYRDGAGRELKREEISAAGRTQAEAVARVRMTGGPLATVRIEAVEGNE